MRYLYLRTFCSLQDLSKDPLQILLQDPFTGPLLARDVAEKERPFLLRGEPTAGFKIRIAGRGWRVTLSSYLIAGGPWGESLVCYFPIVFLGATRPLEAL